MKLLQELIKESQGEFIQALKDRFGKILGYYVADDEDVTNDPAKALKFKTKQEAANDAEVNNSRWDLSPGEKFVAIELTIAKVI